VFQDRPSLVVELSQCFIVLLLFFVTDMF